MCFYSPLFIALILVPYAELLYVVSVVHVVKWGSVFVTTILGVKLTPKLHEKPSSVFPAKPLLGGRGRSSQNLPVYRRYKLSRTGRAMAMDARTKAS
jgi:hypothetical protein